MKPLSTLLLSAFALGLSSQAFAADLPAPISVQPEYRSFDWTGFYVGAQVGYTYGKDHTSEYLTGTNTPTPDAWSFNPKGAHIGIYAGYNYAIGSVVVGAEADIEVADIHGGFIDSTLIGAGKVSTNLQGSVRARLGYAIGERTLVYATGGLAAADMDYTYTRLIISTAHEPVDAKRLGFTVGGGLEYALTDNLILKAEYRYTDFGDFRKVSRVAFGPGVLPPYPNGLTAEQQPSNHSARLGIAYKF